MRKTQEEVKEELRRRRNRYEVRRKARRQRLFGGSIALLVCLAVALLFMQAPSPSPDLIEAGSSRGDRGSVDPASSASSGSMEPSSPPPELSDGDTAVSTTPDPSTDPSDSAETSSSANGADDPDRSPPVPDAPVVSPVGFDLMAGIHAMEVRERKADDQFIRAQMQFAVALLQQTMNRQEEQGANCAVSPLSAQLALAMLANGANGETLKQMEAVLGNGMPISRLNEYLRSYTASLPASEGAKLRLANGIWFPEDGDHPRADFLQANADYYGAEAYQAPRDKLCALINDWVNTNTDGKIEKLFDEVPEDLSMAVANTILFEGKWKKKYTDRSAIERPFTAYSGEQRQVTMLRSTEKIFLQGSDGTVGFLKPYEDERYAFVALLPEEGTDILDYVASLTADRLTKTLKNRRETDVYVLLPKFTFSGDCMLNDALKTMGMPLAFDERTADFARMFNGGGVYLNQFKQKIAIEVSEFGVEAAAVSGGMTAPSTSDYGEETIHLDRPFVYMILDTENNLPLFLGVLTDISDLS